MPGETWRQRYEQARSGPGNGVSRFFRGLLHASSPNDFPLDSRNTFNWFGGDGMGGRNSLAGAAVRGAIDPTGMILRPPQSGSGASGRGGVGRQGSVVANGFVGARGGASGGQPRPSEIGPPRPRPSSSLPQAPNPITRNDPEVDPRVGDPSAGDVVGSGGRSGPTLGNSGYAARPGRGGTVSRQHNLGAGALGSAGDAFTGDHMASLVNRRGLLAER